MTTVRNLRGCRAHLGFLLCLVGCIISAAVGAEAFDQALLNLRFIDFAGHDLPGLEIRIEGYPSFHTSLGGKVQILLAPDVREGDRLNVSLGQQGPNPQKAWTLLWPQNGNFVLPNLGPSGERSLNIVLQTVAERDEMSRLVHEYAFSSWRGNRPSGLTYWFHHEALISLVHDLAERRGDLPDSFTIREIYDSLKQGDFRKAKAYYSRLFGRRDSELPQQRREAAVAARHLGTMVLAKEPDQAIYYFRWAVSLDPEEPSGWNLLGFMLRRQRRFAEAEEAYQKLLTLGRTQHSLGATRLAFGGLGEVHYDAEDYESAQKHLLSALQLNQDLEDDRRAAYEYRRLGFIHRSWGDFGQARKYFNQSLGLGKKLQNTEGVLADQCNLALTDLRQGQIQKAEKALRAYLEQSENVEYQEGVIRGQGALGEIYLRSGDWSAAENRLRQALKLSEAMGFSRLKAKTYILLARLHQDRKELEQGEKNLNQALEIGEALGSELTLAEVYQGFGRLYHAQRNYEFAEEAYEKALDLDQKHRRKPNEALDYLGLALVDQVRGELDRAESRIQQARVLLEAMENTRSLGFTHHLLGSLSERKHQPDLAVNHWNKAVNIFRALGEKRNEARALMDLGSSLYRLDRLEEARNAWNQSRDLYGELGDSERVARVEAHLVRAEHQLRRKR